MGCLQQPCEGRPLFLHVVLDQDWSSGGGASKCLLLMESSAVRAVVVLAPPFQLARRYRAGCMCRMV